MGVVVALPQLIYKCDGCGACCIHFACVANVYDAEREPLILKHSTRLLGSDSERLGRMDYLMNVPPGPCAFLQDDKSCGIYQTRPQNCVAFRAGSESCQEARGLSGLSPLEPIQ